MHHQQDVQLCSCQVNNSQPMQLHDVNVIGLHAKQLSRGAGNLGWFVTSVMVFPKGLGLQNVGGPSTLKKHGDHPVTKNSPLRCCAEACQ